MHHDVYDIVYRPWINTYRFVNSSHEISHPLETIYCRHTQNLHTPLSSVIGLFDLMALIDIFRNKCQLVHFPKI